MITPESCWMNVCSTNCQFVLTNTTFWRRSPMCVLILLQTVVSDRVTVGGNVIGGVIGKRTAITLAGLIILQQAASSIIAVIYIAVPTLALQMLQYRRFNKSSKKHYSSPYLNGCIQQRTYSLSIKFSSLPLSLKTSCRLIFFSIKSLASGFSLE